MKKKQQARQRDTAKVTKKRVIIYGSIGAIVAGIVIFSYFSLVPVNGTTPVFGIPLNHFIQASYGTSGYVWVSQASGSVKGVGPVGGSGIENPTYSFNKGDLESLHITNNDEQTRSQHNFNIDAFNVHSRNLNYFDSQTITFLADKTGTFTYYCSIHPEMKGSIEIH
jgi:hypothetical protein